MHECKYEKTNFNNGVIKYYCKGCKKGFFDRNSSYTIDKQQLTIKPAGLSPLRSAGFFYCVGI